jgi:hypothetical protein
MIWDPDRCDDPACCPGEERKKPGVWLAHNYDGTGVVPFTEEVEALRHALSYSKTVTFATYGDEDWIKGDPK